MKKINILFDASSLYENFNNKSGIHWVAYNILRRFKECPLYQITLIFPYDISSFRENNPEHFLSSFPHYYFIDNKNKYSKNIDVHKEYIKKSKNSFFILIRFLKILKNVILLFLTQEKQDSIRELKKFDVLFSPLNIIPGVIEKNHSIKSFQILYDCIPVLERLSSFYASTPSLPWFLNILKNINQMTYYFCISECTKNDFLKIIPSQLDERKMFVTPIASSQQFSPIYNKVEVQKVLLKYHVIIKSDEQYIFSLCNVDIRKNLAFTIKCFFKFIERNNIDNLYFYLAGGYVPEYINIFMQEISGFTKFYNRVILLGYVDDSDVNILYSNSIFFTFLSLYEGFGLPPLEAMQAGTPVIASDNSSLPEVVGDAAIMIDCNSEEQCINAFENLYYKNDLRKEYIAKGLERAKHFSWGKTFDIISDRIVDVVNNTIGE